MARSSESTSMDQMVQDEHCAKLTRESTPLLDVESPINGAYVLEISSPGMDRLLELPSDFQRFQGFNVSVRLPHRRSKIHGLLTNDDGGLKSKPTSKTGDLSIPRSAVSASSSRGLGAPQKHTLHTTNFTTRGVNPMFSGSNPFGQSHR